MSTTALIVVIITFTVLVVALIVVWSMAKHMKRDLDQKPAGVAGASATVRISPDHARELRALTGEPILLKQAGDGVRVQIDDRPMVPLAVFMGRDVAAALRETAAAVTDEFGPLWVVLVSARDGGDVSVSRLS